MASAIRSPPIFRRCNFASPTWRWNSKQHARCFGGRPPPLTRVQKAPRRFAPWPSASPTDAEYAGANDALQLHGGYGCLCDYGIEKIVHDLRVHRILKGANEIMLRPSSHATFSERRADIREDATCDTGASVISIDPLEPPEDIEQPHFGHGAKFYARAGCIQFQHQHLTRYPVKGEGEHGLFTGSDVGALYSVPSCEHDAFKAFWLEEYELIASLASFPKTLGFIIDSMVMSSGVGSFRGIETPRIATERRASRHAGDRHRLYSGYRRLHGLLTRDGKTTGCPMGHLQPSVAATDAARCRPRGSR